MLKRSLKVTNIVSNGKFDNTTGWEATGSTISALSNTLVVTGDGSDVNARGSQNTGINFIASRKYYFLAKVRVTNANAVGVAVALRSGGILGATPGVVTLNNPTANQWYTFSGIANNIAEVGAIYFQVRHFYADIATANGKVMEIKEALAAEITTILSPDVLALSDANLKTWCDNNFPYWFEGTLNGGTFGGIGGLK